MEISEGVYQLKVPIPTDARLPDSSLGYTLVYLVEQPKGILMVDSGWNAQTSLESLNRQLDELGIAFTDIRWLLVTHYHPDHLGLAANLRELSGAQVILHQAENYHLRQRFNRAAGNDFFLKFSSWLARHGMPKEARDSLAAMQSGPPRYLSEISADVSLEGEKEQVGSSGDLWALWTPGHTPGHLCLYDQRRRLLFSGDHILPTISPSVALHPYSDGNLLGDYIASLRKLSALKVEKALPAHEHIIPHLHSRVNELLIHHQKRLQEVIDALEEGPKNTYQVASRISWNVSAPWPELSPMTRYSAMCETLAHLEHLRTQGLVEHLDTAEQVIFSLAARE